MDRRTAIERILSHLEPTDLLLATTGMTSREAFVTDDRPGNFYMIGSMGLLSSFGLGLALLNSHLRVVIVEGDGSALMSLGAVPLVAYEAPDNLHHIILDNGVYQSTGAQVSISSRLDLGKIVAAAGYRLTLSAYDPDSLDRALATALHSGGPTCVHVRIDVSQVEGIPRVTHAPEAIRDRFAEAVQDTRAGDASTRR